MIPVNELTDLDYEILEKLALLWRPYHYYKRCTG